MRVVRRFHGSFSRMCFTAPRARLSGTCVHMIEALEALLPRVRGSLLMKYDFSIYIIYLLIKLIWFYFI